MLKKFKNWIREEKVNEYGPMIVAFVRDMSDYELEEANKVLEYLQTIVDVEKKTRADI